MWPIGHVAIAYLWYTATRRARVDTVPEPITMVSLAVGGLFPDLIDKPLAWYLAVLPTGRSLAHSLLVLVPLVVLVVLGARQRGVTEYGVAFGLGAVSHAFLDAFPALWSQEATAGFLLWPVISVTPYEDGAPSVLVLLQDSLTNPYFLLEFVFLGLAFVLWRADGYPGLELLRSV